MMSLFTCSQGSLPISQTQRSHLIDRSWGNLGFSVPSAYPICLKAWAKGFCLRINELLCLNGRKTHCKMLEIFLDDEAVTREFQTPTLLTFLWFHHRDFARESHVTNVLQLPGQLSPRSPRDSRPHIDGENTIAFREYAQGINLNFGDLGKVCGQLSQPLNHLHHAISVGGGKMTISA